MRRTALFVILSTLALLAPASARAAAPSAFAKLADQFWDAELLFDPSWATMQGVHDYDDKLIDMSPASLKKRGASLHKWLDAFAKLDAKSLSREEQIDLHTVQQDIRERLVRLESMREPQRYPREYSDAALNAIYLIVKRDFAPAAQRLASVIAREEQIPKLMAAARANLKDPARISIDITLEELPSSIDFLQHDTVDAFAKVADPQLQARLKASTQKATQALTDYGTWLKTKARPKAKDDFALGADTYGKLLAASEGIDQPVDEVLAQGEAELKRLREAFVATAKQIDPTKPAPEVQASLAADHGKPDTLLADVTARLAGLRKFLVDHGIVTIPSTVMPIVQESPPFMRAFTLASMDTPGPYESKATEAYYNVTLPAPSWPPAQVEDYMRGGFSKTVIQLVSIHEAFPGHYVQFLWMPQMPTRTRKLYACNSNAEGWAHYSEQMMIDEGWGNGDPKLRLAQLQEALLRAARYVVGIRMHTKGMSEADGQKFFVTEGLQSSKVAEMEAKRGTQDPTYLYYTWGKLQILKLRADYKKKLGAAYTLRKFHDAFLAQGGVQLADVRRALLE